MIGPAHRNTNRTRRRRIQAAYNREHGIEPASVVREIGSPLVRMGNLDFYDPVGALPRPDLPDAESLAKQIATLEKQMKTAAKDLDFERAAALRDEVRSLRELQIFR